MAPKPAPRPTVFALAHIARNQARLGYPSGAARTIGSALEVAGRMADGLARASALCWIAEAQARSGDRDAALCSIAGALEAVNGAERGSDPDGIGRQIAEAQATAGDNRGALATVRRIVEEPGIDGLLDDISEVQCWENDVVEAVATARRIACAGPGQQCDTHDDGVRPFLPCAVPKALLALAKGGRNDHKRPVRAHRQETERGDTARERL